LISFVKSNDGLAGIGRKTECNMGLIWGLCRSMA
jgi:hypothetical protein